MWDCGLIYKAVSQSLIFYISDRWVMMGYILNVLEGFYHQAVWRITGMTSTHGGGGVWEYAPVVVEMEAAGLHPIRVYIRRNQSNTAEKVACRPIYELYFEVEQMPETIWMVKW